MARQPVVGVGLRVVAQRIKMRQIVADGGKCPVFISPVLGEIGFAACSGGHAIKNRGGHRLQSRLLGADHVNRNAGRLGKFRDVLGWHHAGIVGTIGEHDYDFSARCFEPHLSESARARCRALPHLRRPSSARRARLATGRKSERRLERDPGCKNRMRFCQRFPASE